MSRRRIKTPNLDKLHRRTDSRGRNSRADSDKYGKARDIIRQADNGELTPEEAYAEMKHFLRMGKRTKAKTQTKSDANESIGAMNSALREVSEKIINDAAKNPDTVRALEQLGATVKNGKVTYPDEQTFQACLKFVNSGIVKSSKRGNVDTTIENFVAPKDLNALQRAYAAFAKELGVPIVFFRGDKNLHGMHANGISYYNVNAKFSHEFVYWHEFGHWLKNNQSALFNQLLDAAGITDEQIAEKRKSRPDLSDEELREEIICDAMSDIVRRTELLNQIGKKNSSLIQRLISWARTTLGRFTDWFQTRERGLTTAQRAKMYEAFGKIVRQIEDADGRKIFRYNSRTHEVELADGRKLPTVDTHSKPKYSTEAETEKDHTIDNEKAEQTKKALAELATAAWNDKNYNGKVSFTPSKKFRDKVQELFGHDVDNVFITADDVRHIKREHGEREEQRGQIDIKQENISEIYDVVNNFNSATKERDDRKGNQNIMIVKSSNGTSYAILVERGKSKAQVKTFYKTRRTSQMSDAKSPNLNAQSDSVKSSGENLPQTERDSKANIAGDEEYLQAVDDFRKAKTDEQQRSSFKRLTDMVERAAEVAGFTNAIPEQTVAYKVRTGAAPKKTVKVYKVFTVANDGAPTALFVGGTEKLPQGVWLDAQDAWHFKAKNGKYYVPSTQNPYTKGGKTGASVEIPDEATRQELIERGFLPKGSKATKVTALAYRPGWHAGTLPFFPQGGMKRAGSNYENVHRRNQVVFECELAAEKNYTSEAEAQPKARNKDGTLNTRNADLQRMPENGFYYYATNPLTHGNPKLGMWAISGSLKINRALTQAECDKILADNGKLPQEWEQGELNLADLGYTGEQNDAARKTLAPITYDDEGEIIPLSQRFDASRNDIRYSLDASDNSKESLMQRIRNKLPEWIGGRTDLNERRNKGIKRKLSELSGYKVAFGHTGADETIIDDLQKVIRTRHAYDWEKILPAVGKKIARNLKVSATPEMSNYIADWILTGAPNNTSAEAKAFQKAARENPALFELLNSVRNDFQEYADMSANERVKSKIVSEPPKKSLFERIGKLRRNFKEEFIDDLDPLKRMLTRIKADFGAEIAAKLEAGIDPYKAARLYRGSGGMVDIMIHGKAKDVANIRAALQSMYPNVNFSYFKPLETIIAEAGGLKNLADFEAFCLAMQTKEIHEHNRKHPAEKIKPAFSEADCDEIIKAGAEKFGAAQKDLVAFSKTTLSMMYDAGLLTNESYFRIIRKWKNYVPMARVFDENEEFDFNDSLKQREGSERDIFSPVQKIIANTQEFVRRAERNKVKLNLANLARCGGYGEFVEEVATKKPNVKDIVTFRENGVRKFLQTNPEIVRALNNLQTQSDGVWIFRMLNAATSFMRSALTVFNPDYSAGNIFRDMADAFIHNKYYGTKARPWLAFTDAWRGLMGMVRRDADYYEWLAHGGAQSALVSPDINYSQRMINDITKTARQRWLSKNFFSQVLDTMQKVAEYSEYATRLGTYKRAKTALGTTQTDKRKAALMSRDATIDFARAGSSMRVVNRFAAFSNAAVQGIDRTIRTFDPHKLKTADGRKELFGAVIRLGMAAVLPAILQFALNYADDDRREKYNQRLDWEGETYWIYGDGLRIPKGMDFSLRLASTLTDEFLTSWADGKPFEAKRFAQTIKDAAPSLTATIFTPLVEVGFNRSWFRNAPIVPVREQKLPAHLQFGNETSPVAKFIGEQTGFAPRKIDHLISGYLGFMGRFFSGGTDELPIVRRFIFDPYKNPRIVKEYYEAYDEQTALFNEFKLTKNKPADFDATLYGRLKRAHEPMSKLSKLERKILEDPRLNSDERTAKLHDLERQRIALCERVFTRAQ